MSSEDIERAPSDANREVDGLYRLGAETSPWPAGRVTSRVRIKFTGLDKLRILFGATVIVTTYTDLEYDPGRVKASRSTLYVPRLFSRGGETHASKDSVVAGLPPPAEGEPGGGR